MKKKKRNASHMGDIGEIGKGREKTGSSGEGSRFNPPTGFAQKVGLAQKVRNLHKNSVRFCERRLGYEWTLRRLSRIKFPGYGPCVLIVT